MPPSLEETLAGYQEAARATAIYPGQNNNAGLLYVTLGLVGESGEFATTIKHILRDGVTVDSQDVLVEKLGGLLWYVAAAASELGVSLTDVAELNLDKLRGRFEAGTLRGGDGQ